MKCLQQHQIGSDVNIINIVSFINTMAQWSQSQKYIRHILNARVVLEGAGKVQKTDYGYFFERRKKRKSRKQ